MEIRNKVFVVTGAGSGMGREITKLLVSKGAKVAMVDINTKGMEETAEISGRDKTSIHTLNIANREEVEKLPEQIIGELGDVDGIINNAGIIQPFIDVNDLEYEVIDRIMNINFYGTLFMTKTFLPHLLKRPEASICNISSMGGFIPFPGQTFYGASKAAVKLLTEGLYAELKETNVHCTVIHPGAINTNIMANSGVHLDVSKAEQKGQENMTLPADKAAEVIVQAIVENKFRATVGKDARFLDIFYRFNPRKAVNFILKKMGSMKR
ncbi:Short-chain dehydrogenase [Lishizhenia tianjinensis]|uniref:Short-chain dehydrogenase n=1 Tax=Lishizhenia tianjinensis TaxID=477690 RepID=A0A1I6YVU1_9FLAO|nr:SDR family oxidoreductase [Lishizhenia tianjinensis]SFT54536.1 Short-chain dehydrogenase [Lishizhenia tianjinensis]